MKIFVLIRVMLLKVNKHINRNNLSKFIQFYTMLQFYYIKNIIYIKKIIRNYNFCKWHNNERTVGRNGIINKNMEAEMEQHYLHINQWYKRAISNLKFNTVNLRQH